MKIFLPGLWVLVLAMSLPVYAQDSIAVNMDNAVLKWDYSGDVARVGFWEVGCGTTAGQYQETITRLDDPTIMQEPLKNVIPGPGQYFCAMRAGNEFSVSAWSVEIAFRSGYGPDGDVTPRIEVSGSAAP